MNKLTTTGTREYARLALFFIIVIISISTLVTLPRVSLPIMVSYICYLILNPFIPGLMKLGFSRHGAIIVLLSGLIFFSTYPIYKTLPIVTEEIENVQHYIPKIELYIKSKFILISEEIKVATGYELDEEYISQGINYLKKTTGSLLLNVPNILASLFEWIFLIPLYIFFFLKDGGKFKKFLLKLVPNSIFERFYYITHQFNKQLGDYIFAKFIEAAIVGSIITTGLLLLDVRFAILLGLLAAVTNIIPYVGPVIGAIPGLLLALTEYQTGATFGVIAFLYFMANAIDMAFVFPILVSKIVNLHPVVVVISVILGSQYLGVIGMVISIPLAAALKLISIEVYKEFYSTPSSEY